MRTKLIKKEILKSTFHSELQSFTSNLNEGAMFPMLKFIIAFVITIPVRALFLWIFTGLQFLTEMYLKALITSLVVFSIFMFFNLIEIKGLYAETFKYFFRSLYFQAPLCFLILKKVYQNGWMHTALITIFWIGIQIPINILQTKIYAVLT